MRRKAGDAGEYKETHDAGRVRKSGGWMEEASANLEKERCFYTPPPATESSVL